MATIKSYTDLEQSKKLAKILPIESADMHWKLGVIDTIVIDNNGDFRKYRSIPAWSLAALFSVLPNGIVMNKYAQTGKYHFFSSKYIGTYVTADNPVDACVAMIEKLHELNLL